MIKPIIESKSYSWDFDPSKRQPELLKAWKRFIATGKISAKIVPDHIAESWCRSREHDVDLYRFLPKSLLNPEEYRKQVSRSQRIMNLASPSSKTFSNHSALHAILSLYTIQKGII